MNNLSKYFKCCHNCTERKPACQSTCQKYIEGRAAYDEAQAKIRAGKSDEYADYARNLHDKLMHRQAVGNRKNRKGYK